MVSGMVEKASRVTDATLTKSGPRLFTCPVCNCGISVYNKRLSHLPNPPPAMARSVLSRYLNPDVLNRMVGRRIDPRGLVLGNLAGSHKSPLSGFAVEFAGHREYAWGDDPKHIDWRLFFTRDMLFVKQYEMETNFVCHCLLDASASMRYGEDGQQKLAYSAQMIAALSHAIVHQGDKISLAAFDEKVLGTVTPNSSMAQIIRMAELLDGLTPVNKTRMAECLSELCSRTKRREIVMILRQGIGHTGKIS